MQPTEYIWQNGEFVAWDDARVHVLTHGLHYGTGVFEGVRCYDTPKGPAIFRGIPHMERLIRSAKLYYMDLEYSAEELLDFTKQVITKNGLTDCYIRPLAFRGYGEMGLFPLNSPIEYSISAWEWASYLGDEGKKNGIRAVISSWLRMSGKSFIPQAKASGQYLNSILAKLEAHHAGYQEAILLDERGFVCEGTGENIFVVRNGEIATPGLNSAILEGVNRNAVIEIAGDLGLKVVERDVTRTELVIADEVFMTGTAAELVPVREIDDHLIGDPGPVTRQLQAKFEDALHGRAPEYEHWLDYVTADKPAAQV
ncbi:MAG: branched-chain amino acid transaminase [Solirubrobacterales bacterium]